MERSDPLGVESYPIIHAKSITVCPLDVVVTVQTCGVGGHFVQVHSHCIFARADIIAEAPGHMVIVPGFGRGCLPPVVTGGALGPTDQGQDGEAENE